ncbi:MAG: beta-galactosidase [Lentisphaerota bacterium]
MKIIAFAFALSMTFNALADGQALIPVRSDTFGNWVNPGESITFKPTIALPPEAVEVIGTVRDLDNNLIKESAIPASEFSSKGWSWKPSQPGFDAVSFAFKDSAGKTTRLAEHVNIRIWFGRDGSNRSENIILKPGKIAKDGIITGHIYSVDFKTRKLKQEGEIASHSVETRSYNSSGWLWKIGPAGMLLQVKFTFKDAATGLESPIFDDNNFYVWKNSKIPTERFMEQSLPKTDSMVAVLPSPTRKPADQPEQTSVSVGWGMEWPGQTEKMLRASALLGFKHLRVHAYRWCDIEREEGKYDWKIYDHFIETARKTGFESLSLNPFGTPLWASPNKSEELRILPVYQGYAPVKMESWTNFLKALVVRYPFVKTWELWNEPHLPGQSCFWNDTPENYVKLLKAGYETLKKEQPDATVLLGGIGYRYLPFYDRILQLGAAKYFDVMAVHMRSNLDPAEPKAYRQLEDRNKVERKPWTVSEWHAVLVKGERAPTEDVLARNMALSFIHMVRGGAQQIALFTAIGGWAKGVDMLPYAVDQGAGDFEPADGLFLEVPTLEPRLAASVWRNLIDCFKGKIVYNDGYNFAEGKQSAALVSSDAGKTLIFWQNTRDPLKIDPVLAKAFGSKSELLEWDGRKVNADSSIVLKPVRLYLLRNPEMTEVAKWTGGESVLKKYAGSGSGSADPEFLDQSINGIYTQVPLFGKDLEIDKSTLPVWNKVSYYVSKDGMPEQKGYSARFAAALNNGAIDLLVEVKDGKLVTVDDEPWNGDSIQFALDVSGRGLPDGRMEFVAWRDSKGRFVVKKLKSPGFAGDIPARFTLEGMELGYSEAKFEKTDSGVVYKLRISRDDLYPFAHVSGRPVRFSLLINNNDGSGRAGYYEWGAGIGAAKDAALYGTLTPDIGSSPLIEQKELRYHSEASQLETDAAAGIVKLVSQAGPGQPGSINTANFPVVPNARYKVSFKVRGDIGFQCLVFFRKGENSKRLDLVKNTQLSGEWQNMDKTFTVPEDCEKISLMLLCWEQKGQFEVKDFVLSPARD